MFTATVKNTCENLQLCSTQSSMINFIGTAVNTTQACLHVDLCGWRALQVAIETIVLLAATLGCGQSRVRLLWVGSGIYLVNTTL